jgi:hypothetical protein
MQLEINYSDDEEPSSLYGLSPGTIRNLLHSILMKLDHEQDYRYVLSPCTPWSSWFRRLVLSAGIDVLTTYIRK